MPETNVIDAARPLQGKKVLVTGASRGIGASVACRLAGAGADVGINYRSKGPRAEKVASIVEGLGRHALLLQADITNSEDVARIFDQIRASWGGLNILVLNASGGLEKDRGPEYAMKLNLNAQIALVETALPLMAPEGTIVFVTSHLAHFSNTKPVYRDYEPVALSKKAGEDALLRMLPELNQRGIRLVVVSGDLIDGTITPKLLQRQNPGIIEQRRHDVGFLPNVEEFAAAIVEAAVNSVHQSGSTIYVGSTN